MALVQKTHPHTAYTRVIHSSRTACALHPPDVPAELLAQVPRRDKAKSHACCTACVVTITTTTAAAFAAFTTNSVDAIARARAVII